MKGVPRRPLDERFAEKCGPVDKNGCVPWLGSKYVGGYGQIGVGGKYGRKIRAHRYAYEQVHGPIPDGLVLDHLCRNPSCVNVAHLEAVTQAENILRGDSPAAKHARQTHCLNGHELSPENIAIRYNGWRRCKLCRRV